MNYKKIQTVVRHQFEWEKSFFFFLMLSIVTLKIVLEIFNPHPLINTLGLALTIVPSFMFFKPEFMGKEPGFSAKYLLSFPIKRQELIISQLIVVLFSALPLFLWCVLFYEYTYAFTELFESQSTAAFVLFSFLILVGTQMFTQTYAYARGIQAKAGIRSNAYLYFKVYTGVLLFAVIGGTLSYIFQQQFGINISFYTSALFKYFLIVIQSKLLGVFILLSALYIYTNAKRIAQKDHSSFPKPKNIKKDLKIFGAYTIVAGVCVFGAINVTPQIYQGELQAAVYKKDNNKIQKLLSAGIDINKPNKFGMTPMMVAVFEGYLDIVQNLESKGANYQGEIQKPNDKYHGYDIRLMAVTNNDVKLLEYIKDKVPSFDQSNSLKNLYPIHVASQRCQNKVVDYLISKGVDIEAKTEKGNTPIVIAARNNCFEAVISLKDAGARFDVKDLKGKLALNDLGKRASPEMKIFIEKNMRAPASKQEE